MQYVNCLYSAQGEYLCQKTNKPVVEGFYEDAKLTPEKKLSIKYIDMKNSCTSTNTDVNKKKCIEQLATFHNDKCGKSACSPLSTCGTSRQNACSGQQLKKCSDTKFSQSMITNGTNYITKKTVIPDEKGMPNIC